MPTSIGTASGCRGVCRGVEMTKSIESAHEQGDPAGDSGWGGHGCILRISAVGPCGLTVVDDDAGAACAHAVNIADKRRSIGRGRGLGAMRRAGDDAGFRGL